MVEEKSGGSIEATEDMPRERLRRCGPEALKDHELVAILLGTGCRGNGVVDVARSILAAHPKEELMTDVAAFARHTERCWASQSLRFRSRF